MEKEICITITREDTLLTMDEDTTELDVVLAIGALYDRLRPEVKEIVVEKMKNIKDLEKGIIHNLDSCK